MKKFAALLLAGAMAFSMMACGSSSDKKADDKSSDSKKTESAKSTSASDIKVGVIYIGDENEGYTEAHMKGIQEMKKELGLSDDQIIEKTLIPEDETCYDAAVDLAEQGCNIIFGTSFGHESYLLQAAAEYPDVQFCHATGYQAASSGLSNMHNYFDAIYEARYVSGVVAGMKLNEMIENGDITADQAKIGYVGAFPYAEVISGYTAFYLGAKSVCPSVTMEVKYTNSWFDIAKEKETANALIADGCVLISQHADSEGAPKACEEAKVPNVAYNLDTREWGPNSALISSKINWEPYFEHIIKAVENSTAIEQDFCKGLADGSVEILGLNDAVAAPGTAEKLEEVKKDIIDGNVKVFDTANFTVGGEHLTSYMADVDTDDNFTPDTEVIEDGVFMESAKRSAPYFDIVIDGITEK